MASQNKQIKHSAFKFKKTYSFELNCRFYFNLGKLILRNMRVTKSVKGFQRLKFTGKFVTPERKGKSIVIRNF